MKSFSLVTVVILLSAPGLAPAQPSRTLTVVNSCPQGKTLNVGAVGGAVSQKCTSPNYSCPAGTACNRDNQSCYWVLPSPTKGTSVLASGDKVIYTLSSPPIEQVQWSGNIYAATGCDSEGNNCQTGMCYSNGKPVVCSTAGVGPFAGPLSLAEFTLISNNQDSYDVSLINGLNVPISIAPASVTTQSGSNAYFCQTAGSTTASSTGLSACSWTFSPSSSQAPFLALVNPSSPTTLCNPPNVACPTGLTCGLAPTFGQTTVTQLCGTQIGWWTPDEICTFTNNSFGGPIFCSDNVALYQCIGDNANSCYTPGASPSCCGCPSWVINGKELPTTASCANTNSSWATQSLPWLSVFKAACPTAYTFPYDDATSSFTCTTANNPNTMSYTITFCPGGQTGF